MSVYDRQRLRINQYCDLHRPKAYTQHSKCTEWKQQWPIFADVSDHAAQRTINQIHKDLKVLKKHWKNGRKTGRLK